MASTENKGLDLLKVAFLDNEKVRMKDKACVIEKLKKMTKDGVGKLQIITDFDRTISKHHHDGVTTPSSYGVFEMIPTLPRSFIDGAAALYKKFRVIEDDPHMTMEEKLPHMEDWWNLNEKLVTGVEYNTDKIEEAICESQVALRDGTESAFKKLLDNNIPVLVFSAGLGDVVEGILKHYKLNLSNVRVISNFFSHENGVVTGFKGTLIHVYNKNQHAIENSEYFEELSHRPNVILMGDSLGDANMAEGVPGEGAVLKIGFLSVNIEHFLPQYLDKFDIVLLDDQTMDVFNGILNAVL